MTEENNELRQDSANQDGQPCNEETYFEHVNQRANKTEQSVWSFGGDIESEPDSE